MAVDEARTFFDKIAGRYERVYALPGDESRARLARTLAALPPKARVLDLGVGTGRELSTLLDAGHAVTGLDLSPGMLARCARRARPVPLVQADMWQPLPFEGASFDAVLALHGTLAHPPSGEALQGLLAEVARVLASGGKLVVEVPLPAWLETAARARDEERLVERFDHGRGRFTDRATGATIEVMLYSQESWRDMLGRAGMLAERDSVDGEELFLTAKS
jgi:SAM-dependent methyltransferase